MVLRHHHNAAGENVPYSYSYLFAYSMELSPGARTLRLPGNGKVRVLAVSVAEENPEVAAAQPLYDVLPAPSERGADVIRAISDR